MPALKASRPEAELTANRPRIGLLGGRTNCEANIKTNCIQEKTAANQTEYLLALMRCTVMRLRLQRAEIEQVGVSLKGGVVDPKTAVDWLIDLGVLADDEVPAWAIIH